MAIAIAWSIEGEKQLSRQLMGVSDAAGNLGVPFKRVTKKLKKVYSNDVFRTRGRAVNARWAALSPRTVIKKRTNKPLIETGRMKQSFRAKSGKDYAVIWNPTPYFAYHQSNQPRQKIPRRVMLALTPQHRALVARELNTHLKNKMLQK